MSLSNYPPGVTGNEPQITGEFLTPGERRVIKEIIGDLEKLGEEVDNAGSRLLDVIDADDAVHNLLRATQESLQDACNELEELE